MRAACLVADIGKTVVPDLSVPIESPDAFAVDVNLVAAEDEGRGLVLIAHGHGVCKPVLDIGAPEKGACDFYFDVGEAGDLHRGIDVVYHMEQVSQNTSNSASRCIMSLQYVHRSASKITLPLWPHFSKASMMRGALSWPSPAETTLHIVRRVSSAWNFHGAPG